MTKQDFIRILRQNLSGMADYEYVNDTVSYYENYIESEIRKGKSEEEVLNMLGDPRLIAKSVKASKGAQSNEDVANTAEDIDSVANRKRSLIERFLSLPPWVVKTTVFVGVIVVVTIVALLISWMFPVLVIGGIAFFFYKFVRDNFLN